MEQRGRGGKMGINHAYCGNFVSLSLSSLFIITGP